MMFFALHPVGFAFLGLSGLLGRLVVQLAWRSQWVVGSGAS